MTTQAAAETALVAYVVFLLLAFGLRTVVQVRRTGASGFVGLSGQPGSAEWWGGALFVVALVAGAAAPLLQWLGVLVPLWLLSSPGLRWIGGGLYIAGVVATLWAQFSMGDSWRIGVDPAARTELVGAGPFGWVRNPIFSAMSVATIGIALLVPNWASAIAVVALLVALELQVRLVEEPYLLRAHGDAYRRYAAQVGRFVPGLGRLATGGDPSSMTAALRDVDEDARRGRAESDCRQV